MLGCLPLFIAPIAAGLTVSYFIVHCYSYLCFNISTTILLFFTLLLLQVDPFYPQIRYLRI